MTMRKRPEQRPAKNRCRIAALLVVVLAAATFGRNQLYRDPAALWADAARKAPGKARPRYNLSLLYRDQGRMDLARAEWERIIVIDPAFSQAYNHLGILAYLNGEQEKALRYYLRAVETGPQNAEAQYNLALTYEALGRRTEAIAGYERFLSLVSEDQRDLAADVRRRIAGLRK